MVPGVPPHLSEPRAVSAPPPGAERASLFEKSARGALWSVGAQVSGQGAHLVTRLVLARLLAPADFGLVAMAAVAVSFTWWVIDLGMGPAIVQKAELTGEVLSTAFWSTAGVGILVFLGLAAAAPLVGDFYGNPDVVPLLILLAAGVLFAAPESVFSALFERRLDYRVLAQRRMVSIVLGGSAGIGLALGGFGPWALAAESLVRGASASLLLCVRAGWRPRFVFSGPAFAELWSFSGFLTASRLLGCFNRNLDTLLVGKFLGGAALGFYNLAYQCVLLPLAYLVRPVNSVFFPTLSLIRNEAERFRSAYVRTIELMAGAVFPVTALVALCARDAVPLLLGEKWRPAVPLVLPFCALGMIQSFLSTAFLAAQAVGDTRRAFRWNTLLFLATVTALLAGLPRGAEGVAWALVIANFVVAVPILSLHLRMLGIPVRRYLRAFLAPLAAVAALVAAWFTSGQWTGELRGAVPLALRATVSCTAYGAVLWMSSRTVRRSLGMVTVRR